MATTRGHVVLLTFLCLLGVVAAVPPVRDTLIGRLVLTGPADGGGNTFTNVVIPAIDTAVSNHNVAVGQHVTQFGGKVDTTDPRLTDARTPTAHNQAWSTITGPPTTLAGYGITDAATATQGAKADTASQPGHTHSTNAITDAGDLIGRDAADLTTDLLTGIDWDTVGSNTVDTVNGETGDVVLTAVDIGCTGTYATVQAALNALFYVAPDITSFSGGAAYVKGQTIASPVVTWVVNKTMTTRALSGAVAATLGAGGSGTYTDTGRNMDMNTASKTYTLTVGDGTGTDAASTAFSFTNRRYVGKSSTTNQTNAEIIAMTASTQAKGASGVTGAMSAEYIVVAYPASLGACTSFTIAGLPDSTLSSVTKSVTNAYGYAESYLVYRNENALTAGSVVYVLQ